MSAAACSEEMIFTVWALEAIDYISLDFDVDLATVGTEAPYGLSFQ